jgi:predicted Zn finger-like uncharacterized protein
MSTVRLRRLKADHDKLQHYVRRHPRVRLIQSDGDPPERYQLEYRINSLRMVGTDLHEVQSHIVEVSLPRNYPRTPPQCRMLSPVFHPNIAPHAICVGDHWGPGESLESIVIRIGEMLAYQSYNVKSPLNGEAARWVEQNKHRVPLDAVSLLPEDDSHPAPAPNSHGMALPISVAEPTGPAPTNGVSHPVSHPRQSTRQMAAPSAAAGAPGSSPVQIVVKCPSCAAAYRVSAQLAGRAVRCKCGQSFRCEPTGTPPSQPL